MAMCQVVVCTFILSLSAHLQYVKGAFSKNNGLALNNSSRPLNNILINGAPGKRKPNSHSFDVRILNAGTANYRFNYDQSRNIKLNSPTLKAGLHFFRKSSNRLLNSSTPGTHSLNFPTVNAHSLNPQRLGNSLLNISALRYRTINSPSPKVRTLFFQKRSNSTPNSPTLRTRRRISPRFNARTVNFHKISNHTHNVPTLRTRTLNSPAFNRLKLNYSTPNPNMHNTAKPNVQTLKDQIFDDQKLNEWLEDTIVKPDEDYKDSRRSHIDGLMRFKKKVNLINEKKKKGSYFNDDDIIPNDKYELDNMLAYSEAVPNFEESYADKAAEDFHRIQSEYLEHKVKEHEESGRRHNDYITRRTKKPIVMDRILALMNQFLMQAHNKLINGELLRFKYKVFVKFKIGYVFATLRILKQHQMRLYSSMHFNRFYPPITKGLNYAKVADSMYYLMLYEKVIRLDDDIVTLVKYLWTLEEERRKAAIVEATKFPKRKKVTPPIVATYYAVPPKYGW